MPDLSPIHVHHAHDTLRVEIRFKNARLFDAIVEHDLPVLPAKSAAGQVAAQRGATKRFCDFYGLRLETVYALGNLKVTPYRNGRTLTPLAQRLCALLEKEPAWLFPMSLYEDRVRKELSRRRITYLAEASSDFLSARLLQAVETSNRGLLPAPTVASDEQVNHGELATLLRSCLRALSPLQERVIRLRFGLDGGDEMTQRQIGVLLGFTASRVSQIEMSALRKLKHPARSKRLKGLL